MTGCQGNLLKIKLGEIASGELTSGEQEGGDEETVGFWPRKPARLQSSFPRPADGELDCFINCL